MTPVTTALMYHELERDGRPLAASDPGYLRYVVGEGRFVEQLEWLIASGLRGVSLGDASRARFAARGHVAITFDDGCESDWIVAAPHLHARQFGATFYVVSSWVGRAGFLDARQLRELAAAGFEVGSHSATHAFLTDLDERTLRRELRDSRQALEDLLGRPVVHLSCPGGRANRRVAAAARAAGYETMATSRIGANSPATDRFALARNPIRRHLPQRTFEAFCRGEGLVGLQLRERALGLAKTILGNRAYVSLRRAVVRA